ncbi:MAG TPA: ABC transporter substrate-binding protein [Bryobacteraceae bacterium]|nr:ABC transporter substrate-binding protein [Bryobacteraceae bacterium]
MLRRTLLLLPVAPMAALVSCRRRSGRDRMPLRVSLSRILTMAPFYVGYEAGYFRDAGFDIQLSKELPGVQSLPLLAAGSLDVGFVGLTPGMVNAVRRGARLRLVAGREISSRSCDIHSRIFVRASDFPQGIPDLRPLRGRRIALSSSSVFGYFCLDQLLARAGMKRSDVVIRPMGANDRLAALRAGGVDAFLSTGSDMNPMLRQLQIAPGPGLADVLPGFQYSYIAFGARLLDADVRRGAAFLRAYLRGAREYLGGKTPAFVEQYAKDAGLDPKLVRAGCRDSFEADGHMHQNDIKMFLDWLITQNYIPEAARVESVVDTRFLNEMQRTA